MAFGSDTKEFKLFFPLPLAEMGPWDIKYFFPVLNTQKGTILTFRNGGQSLRTQ